MTSICHSDTTSMSPIVEHTEKKPKRRSSIFRPDLSATASNETNYYAFPQEYIEKLMQENVGWKEFYTSIKSECRDLQKKARHNTEQPICSENLAVYENYVKKAEIFIHQVDTVVKWHKIAVKYRIMRRKELETQIQLSRKDICERLNL